MNAAEVIDRVLTDRVLVFGSLPPHGRDLDLLVRSEEGTQLEAALDEAGFSRKGNQWARFEGCTTEVVESIPIGDWDLGETQIDLLFTKAVSLEGYRNLARPSAADSLVIMARRMARAGGELDEKKRARVKTALEEDPDGWANAQVTGRAWGSYRAVIALERLYKSGIPTSRWKRAGALAERHRHAGRRAPRLRAWKTVLSAMRGPGLVTFSGLDGSGKTSQAEALKDSIERTTGDAVVVWTRLSYNPSLKTLARPIKALLSARRGGTQTGEAALAPADRGKELRRKSPAITQVWATAVAVANAASQRRMTGYHLRRGKMVLCDRYTLDSRVHLRYRYGTDRPFRMQGRLIRALSPKPLRSYLIDVPPEVAYERKPEQYDLEQLRTQSELYREEYEGLGVRRLDGTRPKQDLCKEIAEEIWRALD